jgi:hypothetical protein
MDDRHFEATQGLVAEIKRIVAGLHRQPAGAILSCAFAKDLFVTGCLRFLEDAVPERKPLAYGDLLLTEFWFPFERVDALLDGIASGTAVVDRRPLGKSSSGGYIRRVLENTASGWPEWQARVGLDGAQQRAEVAGRLTHDPVIAFGNPPFMNPFHAVGDWVFGDVRSWSSTSVRSDEITVWIPDTRGRFLQSEWIPGRVRLNLDLRADAPAVQVQFRFLGSRSVRAALVGATAAVEHEVPEDAESVVAFLVHERSELLGQVNLGRWSQPPPESSDEPLTVAGQTKKDIAECEGPYVEFKEFVKLKDSKEAELERTIVAFANTGGGRLYLGVRDDRTLQGNTAAREAGKEVDVEKSVAALARRLESEIANWIKPERPPIVVHHVELSGNAVIAVHVSRGDQVYSTNDETIYVRRGANSAKASVSDIRELIGSVAGFRGPVTSKRRSR